MLSRKLHDEEDDAPGRRHIAIVSPRARREGSGSSLEEHDDESTSLESFQSETELTAPGAAPKGRDLRVLWAVLLALVLTVPAAWLGWQAWRGRAVASPAAAAGAPAGNGTAMVTTMPAGAAVTIDGVAHGATPIKVQLAPGAHTLQITHGAVTRTIPLTIEPGTVVSQYVELAAPAVVGGRLEVGSDPPGAPVRLDGTARGVTPLAFTDVPAGQHTVSVTIGTEVINRTVNVTRGATATVLVSATGAASAPASGGWLAVDAPVEMEIFEDDRLLGTTRSERLMLPVGTHRLTLVNSGLEVSMARTVQVAAGRTSTLSLALPSGKLAVNAIPWAEVFVDGSPVGVTPLGELSVPVGTRELIFRHPQFGERRQSVTVRASTPSRIGVDLRK